MHAPRRLRAFVGLLGATAIVGGAVALAGPSAYADTGACVSYLEDIGQDTTARVQICAETETIADTVSQEAALSVCVPLMMATLLPQPHAQQACHLAVAP